MFLSGPSPFGEIGFFLGKQALKGIKDCTKIRKYNKKGFIYNIFLGVDFFTVFSVF